MSSIPIGTWWNDSLTSLFLAFTAPLLREKARARARERERKRERESITLVATSRPVSRIDVRDAPWLPRICPSTHSLTFPLQVQLQSQLFTALPQLLLLCKPVFLPLFLFFPYHPVFVLFLFLCFSLSASQSRSALPRGGQEFFFLDLVRKLCCSFLHSLTGFCSSNLKRCFPFTRCHSNVV